MSKEHNGKFDDDHKTRVVLWHLATIQAQLVLMQSDLIQERVKRHGGSDKDVLIETVRHGRKIYRHALPIYQDALSKAGIKPEPNFPPKR